MIEFEIHRPAEQPSGEPDLCPACHKPLLRLAAFCSACGQAHPRSPANWSHHWKGGNLHSVSAGRDLLALAEDRSIWLIDLRLGHPLARLHSSEAILHCRLSDTYCHLWTAHHYHRISLTSALNGRAIRQQPQAHLPLRGPGLIPPVSSLSGAWAWPINHQLQRILPGLQRAAPIPLESSSECLAVTSWQEFWVVADRSGLRWWDQKTGQLHRVENWDPPPRSLSSHPQGVFALDDAGQVWLSHPVGRQCLLHQPPRPGFSIAAAGQHVLLCQGRQIQVLELSSGRWQKLALPQAVVLPALIAKQQALLTSYDGSFYQLALDHEPIQILASQRLFDSSEPYTQPVAWNGHQVVWLSADNQLVSRPFPT